MRKFAIIGLVILAGCYRMMKPVERAISPSGSFVVAAIPNDSKTDPTKYRCIRLVLMDQNGATLSAIQTGVSDGQKWAVGWMESQDVIVLQSSDIGTQSFKVETNKLVQISVTPAIEACAAQLKKLKYKR